MKIALPATANSLDAAFESRFGRAAGFLIYNTETQTSEYIDNKANIDAAQGAGIQAAQSIVASGAEVLITSQCGPKALQVLDSAGVRLYACSAATLAECLQLYNAGSLEVIESATTPGHS